VKLKTVIICILDELILESLKTRADSLLEGVPLLFKDA